MTGLLILGSDWLLFSGTAVSGGLLVLLMSFFGFFLGCLVTVVGQRRFAKEPMSLKLGVKSLVGGLIVGVPFPVAGTLVGGATLVLSRLFGLRPQEALTTAAKVLGSVQPPQKDVVSRRKQVPRGKAERVTTMMECPACGSGIGQSDAECPSCGVSVGVCSGCGMLKRASQLVTSPSPFPGAAPMSSLVCGRCFDREVREAADRQREADRLADAAEPIRDLWGRD